MMEFEQELRGTPGAVEVETESDGIEIFVDYVVFDAASRGGKEP